MSSSMVSAEHINVMVWMAGKRATPVAQPFAAVIGDRSFAAGSQAEKDALGQFLIEANQASLNALYGDMFGPVNYQYRRPRWTSWSALEVADSVSSFQYQACDAGSPLAADAVALCNALRLHLLDLVIVEASSPGVWMIDDDSVPAAMSHLKG